MLRGIFISDGTPATKTGSKETSTSFSDSLLSPDRASRFFALPILDEHTPRLAHSLAAYVRVNKLDGLFRESSGDRPQPAGGGSTQASENALERLILVGDDYAVSKSRLLRQVTRQALTAI